MREQSKNNIWLRIERTFEARAQHVFQAFADPAAKPRWFGGEPDCWRPLERSMDFQVDGRERARGQWAGGPRRTLLSITGQGAFLDGYDDAGSREQGTAGLLERIAATL